MKPEAEASIAEQSGRKHIEDLAEARMGVTGQQELWGAQTECVFTFLQEGLPTAVVMSYEVDHQGHFWFATVEGRRQVRGVDSDPHVAVVVSNTGTELPGRRMVALRGTAQVHRERGVVLPTIQRLAPRLAPDDPDAFVRLLDSPNRVVIEVAPTRITASHDSTRLAGDGRGGQLNA